MGTTKAGIVIMEGAPFMADGSMRRTLTTVEDDPIPLPSTFTARSWIRTCEVKYGRRKLRHRTRWWGRNERSTLGWAAGRVAKVERAVPYFSTCSRYGRLYDESSVVSWPRLRRRRR